MSKYPKPPPWAEYATYIWATSRMTYAEVGERVGHKASNVCFGTNKFLMNVCPHAVTDYLYDSRLSVWGEAKRELARSYFKGKPPPGPLPPKTMASLSKRNAQIFEARRSGKTFKQIGMEHDALSATRVQQIVRGVERKLNHASRVLWFRAQFARIQDPDESQRDAWLTFTVPLDPRFDAMEPVQ